MDKILETRKNLLEKYEILRKKEQKLDELVLSKERNKDIIYEVDKAHFCYHKDKIVVELLETQKALFNEIKKVSEEICVVLQDKSKNNNVNNLNERLDFAEERKVAFDKAQERISSVIDFNNDDIYEMELALKEIDNIIYVKDETLLTEALVNFRILRDVANIYSIETENELFEMAQNVLKNLTEKLNSYKGQELGE